MNIRIKDVERITLHVPFTPRCEEWNALLVWNWAVVEIIRITSDTADLVGYGETLPHYTWGTVSDAAIARVKGRNAAELLGDDSLGAGLQMAIYDLVGKALGVPMWKLFNLPQVRSHAVIAWWNTKMSPEGLAAEAQEAVAQGYRAHKFKVRPWIDVYAQVEAVSAVTPSDYKIDVDWNEMLLNVGNAARVLQELDQYERIAIYEGPIPQRDIEGWKHLRRKTNRPLAQHFGVPPFATSVREEVCDGYVINGGISGVLRDGLLASAFEKPFWLQLVGTGLVTAMAAHLAAVLPMAQWPMITCLNNYSDDLLIEPLSIQHGLIKVPDQPGLGVEIDEAALRRYRMQPPYALPERRHILSVVWPNGKVVHYAHMNSAISAHNQQFFPAPMQAETLPPIGRVQCWEDFHAGNHPVQERGVTMQIWQDDGTPEWAELYARARRGPLHM
jgi:L-alanine-DL-glutamate epimerase-like enolase superfamily enzyme